MGSRELEILSKTMDKIFQPEPLARDLIAFLDAHKANIELTLDGDRYMTCVYFDEEDGCWVLSMTNKKDERFETLEMALRYYQRLQVLS